MHISTFHLVANQMFAFNSIMSKPLCHFGNYDTDDNGDDETCDNYDPQEDLDMMFDEDDDYNDC